MKIRLLDLGTIVIIGITFLLFVLALFEKGFTHDMLLEAGVFLVSVKLIIIVPPKQPGCSRHARPTGRDPASACAVGEFEGRLGVWADQKLGG
jgi:hypothetical protein